MDYAFLLLIAYNLVYYQKMIPSIFISALSIVFYYFVRKADFVATIFGGFLFLSIPRSIAEYFIFFFKSYDNPIVQTKSSNRFQSRKYPFFLRLLQAHNFSFLIRFLIYYYDHLNSSYKNTNLKYYNMLKLTPILLVSFFVSFFICKKRKKVLF